MPEASLPVLPFADLMGVTICEATKTRIVGRLTVREELTTGGYILHGGAYMAFADSLGAVAGYLNLPSGARTTRPTSLRQPFAHAGCSAAGGARARRADCADARHRSGRPRRRP